LQACGIHLVHTRSRFVDPWSAGLLWSKLTSCFIDYVQWIEDTLIKAVQLAPPSLKISIRIFITDPLSIAGSELSISALSSPVEKKGAPEHNVTKRDSLSSLLSLRGVKMEAGRPNLDALLKEEISSASGRISVSGKYRSRPQEIQVTNKSIVCGSQGISRAVRHALRFPVSGPSTILSGGPSVTLYDESFGYA
jgi:ferric-chelate reductase